MREGGRAAVETLQERWERAVVAFSGDDAGRSVRVSGRGVSIGAAEDVVRPGASVNKLFVALAVSLAIERGDLDPTATYAVEDLPPSRWPAVTCALSPQHRLSVAELTGLMMATSDNRVSEFLVQLLGPERITETAVSAGCADTELAVGFADEHLGPTGRANVTTCRDCDHALTTLRTDPAHAWLLPSMRSSLFNTRILSSMPDDVVVSHKTGSLAGVVNDVGVIHAPGGDVQVSFLSDAQTDRARTSADIGRCARAVLDAVVAFDGIVDDRGRGR